MAYDPSNPPNLKAQGIAGEHAGRIFTYYNSDDISLVLAAGYITNAQVIGLRVGDSLLYTNLAMGQWQKDHLVVSAVDDDTGAATLVFPDIPAEALPEQETVDLDSDLFVIMAGGRMSKARLDAINVQPSTALAAGRAGFLPAPPLANRFFKRFIDPITGNWTSDLGVTINARDTDDHDSLLADALDYVLDDGQREVQAIGQFTITEPIAFGGDSRNMSGLRLIGRGGIIPVAANHFNNDILNIIETVGTRFMWDGDADASMLTVYPFEKTAGSWRHLHGITLKDFLLDGMGVAGMCFDLKTTDNFRGFSVYGTRFKDAGWSLGVADPDDVPGIHDVASNGALFHDCHATNVGTGITGGVPLVFWGNSGSYPVGGGGNANWNEMVFVGGSFHNTAGQTTAVDAEFSDSATLLGTKWGGNFNLHAYDTGSRTLRDGVATGEGGVAVDFHFHGYTGGNIVVKESIAHPDDREYGPWDHHIVDFSTQNGGRITQTDRAGSQVEIAYRSKILPQLKLTLTAGIINPTLDVTAATRIYGLPGSGFCVPWYNQAELRDVEFDEAGVYCDLDGTAGHFQRIVSGFNYDVYMTAVGGTPRIGTGPAWSVGSVASANADLARATGTASTELELMEGYLWVNKNSLGVRYGTGTDDFASCPARTATYLGTIRATGNGQASDSKRQRLLFNAYGQELRPIGFNLAADTGGYGTAAYRYLNNAATSRIEWMRGLPGGAIDATLRGDVTNSTATLREYRLALGLNGITSGDIPNDSIAYIQAETVRRGASIRWSGDAGLGFNWLAGLEYAAGTDTQTLKQGAGINGSLRL